MAVLSARLHLVALAVLPTALLSVSMSVRMSLSVNWALFHHLSQHQREVAEHMAQGLGDQALANC